MAKRAGQRGVLSRDLIVISVTERPYGIPFPVWPMEWHDLSSFRLQTAGKEDRLTACPRRSLDHGASA
ncbi:hypothetical protein MES5069_200025 [Mesorhizobium escarrei]|uniref:Uncharacterized protein n=1 Tax=Mesorhizobium escarrei TaxID=666018 RepID=A0ABN8JP83_9HYPH|nr:hypothetical protein MES5069_200025 [Mesorhizobium escarrei]